MSVSPAARRAAVLLAVVAAGACTKPAPATPVTQFTVGGGRASVHVELDPFSVEILRPDGVPVLRSLPAVNGGAYGGPAATADNFTEHDQLIPGWDGYVAMEDPWQQSSTAVLDSHDDTSATVHFDVKDGRLFLDISVVDTRVLLHVRAEQPAGLRPSQRFNKTSLSFVLPPEEHFLGLGERYGTTDHRGWSFYSYAEEAGVGAGEDVPASATNPSPSGVSMTYFPVPWMLSTQGYGFHANTTFRTEQHLGSERPDAWRTVAGTADWKMTVYVNADPRESLDQYTQDTGRPMVPAPWVFGNRRRINRGAMRDGVPEWQRMRDRHMPITGIDDATHFLPHRSELGHTDELLAWTRTLHDNGFKVLAYYNPYVSASLPAAAEDYATGLANHWFLSTPDGMPSLTFFISGVGQQIAGIDLTFPDAVNWFETIQQRSVDLGYDGWMHDFGEYTARAVVAHDGRTGEELHNAYPVLSAKAAHDFNERVRPNDYLFFVRGGGVGTQAHAPAVWGGDAEASFDQTQGLPAMLRGGVNLGLSGVPYFGADAQGYKCLNEGVDRNKELFYRWLQFSAVNPIMQDQDRCFALTMERTKWFLWDDQETGDEYARYASLHVRLQPYFMTLAQEAHATGMPIMRHPFLLHPTQPDVAAISDAFYLGPSLYTLPVVKRGQFTKAAWIPPGRWVDWWTRQVVVGGNTVTLETPVTTLPLLLAENTLVPMLDPAVQTLAPATVPGVVTAQSTGDRLDIVGALSPGGTATFTLADGTVLHAQRVATHAGNPDSLLTVTQADLADCARCFLADSSGETQRLRVNSAETSTSTLTLEDLVLSHAGSQPRRVRWEVLRLP